MKLSINLFILCFIVNSAQAQVYKCENANGHVVYQDSKCTRNKNQKKITLHQFDSKITQAAQQKLKQEILQREKTKAIEAERALKEREINAIEQQVKSNKALTQTAREQAEALERNTAAVKSKSQNRVYYPLPINRAYHDKKHSKQYKQETGLKVDISIK